MSNPKLKDAFVALGHDDKKASYCAECEDSEEYLARHGFLRLLWNEVVAPPSDPDATPKWIDAWLRAAAAGNTSTSKVADALKRVLACGVDPKDLTAIVRAEQVELLFNTLLLLDGEGLQHLGLDLPGNPEAYWRLFQLRGYESTLENVVRPMESLHEEMGDLDPQRKTDT